MKTPSGTLIVIIAAVIAIGSVLIFRTFAQGPGKLPDDKKFTLHIGHGDEDWAEINKPAFDEALRPLDLKKQFSIRYKKDKDAKVDPDYHPPRISLKTDKVTTSELAKNAPPGDPHVTQRVTSNSVEDIKKVLDALVTPTPTPNQ